MNQYGYHSLPLLALILTAGPLFAQDSTDFAGTWASVFAGTAPQGRCGRKLIFSELEVTGTVADTKRPTYEAMVTVWITSERCMSVTKDSSKARLVVRGTRVSLSYEAEEWGSEMLVRDGNTMSGIDESGLSLEWKRPPELPLSLQTNMVRQNIINNMKKSRIEEMRASVEAGGKSAEEAAEITPKLIEGFANCIVDIAQVQAAIQRLPFDELLKIYDPVSGDEANPRVVRKLDKIAVEARTRACFYEVGEAQGAQVL